mmetsp:Transcript_46759/g.108443  ORF Transcript_46759/g.108443 Transcript_46759/m.108443 type:complete len:311 (-) Transcript_46759:1208-2140(-)
MCHSELTHADPLLRHSASGCAGGCLNPTRSEGEDAPVGGRVVHVAGQDLPIRVAGLLSDLKLASLLRHDVGNHALGLHGLLGLRSLLRHLGALGCGEGRERLRNLGFRAGLDGVRLAARPPEHLRGLLQGALAQLHGLLLRPAARRLLLPREGLLLPLKRLPLPTLRLGLPAEGLRADSLLVLRPADGRRGLPLGRRPAAPLRLPRLLRLLRRPRLDLGAAQGRLGLKRAALLLDLGPKVSGLELGAAADHLGLHVGAEADPPRLRLRLPPQLLGDLRGGAALLLRLGPDLPRLRLRPPPGERLGLGHLR